MGIKSHGASSQVAAEHLGENQQIGSVILHAVLVARVDAANHRDCRREMGASASVDASAAGAALAALA
jgi:hypothetical protein